MLSKFKYIIKESFRGFFTTLTPLFLSTVTISISLIVITLSFYSYILFITYSDSITSDYKLEVFFENNLDNQTAYETYTKILSIKEVSKGVFIDKQKSSDKFEEYFNEKIESLVGSNILPFSGEFSISDEYRTPESLLDISKNILEIENVESVVYDKEILLRTYGIVNNIMAVFSIIGFSIIIVSIILVSNTTRLIIDSKKNNIQILSLMGATNLLIRIPFLVEGFIQGLMGAFVSILFLFGLKGVVEYIFFPFIIEFDNNIQFLIILNIVLGAMLGLIGSKRSVSKYLP